jgi:hypothetical protein
MSQINLNLADSTKVKLIKQEGTATPDQGLFLVPFCYRLILVTLILMLPDIWKVTRVRITTATSKYFHLSPCRNCCFFKNNRYLCCAVYPSIVLTKQSLDCPDYRLAK